MQSEAFSEPVFQKQGKLVTFFRGFVLPRTLIGKSRRKKVFQVDLAEHLFTVGIYGIIIYFYSSIKSCHRHCIKFGIVYRFLQITFSVITL